MRKTKFRIRDTLENKWVQSHIGLMANGTLVWHHNNEEVLDALGIRYVIQFYINLEDKKGDEIYEGDIVKVTWNNLPEVYQIAWGGHWKYTGFGIHGPRKNKWSENAPDFVWEILGPLHVSGIKVIGNIYENEEMLDG